jgi:hypothetical protein
MNFRNVVLAGVAGFALVLPATQSFAADTPPVAPAAPAAPAPAEAKPAETKPATPAAAAPAPVVPAAPTSATPAPVAPAAPAPAAPATATPAPAAPTPARLTGVQAWAALQGNTVQGKLDGKDYYEFYKEDGTVKALTGESDLETGKWALEGGKLCTVFPGEDRECYTIEVIGDIVNFTDEKGKGVRWTVLKGNPKSL